VCSADTRDRLPRGAAVLEVWSDDEDVGDVIIVIVAADGFLVVWWILRMKCSGGFAHGDGGRLRERCLAGVEAAGVRAWRLTRR
jgi:hypothetical protein